MSYFWRRVRTSSLNLVVLCVDKVVKAALRTPQLKRCGICRWTKLAEDGPGEQQRKVSCQSVSQVRAVGDGILRSVKETWKVSHIGPTGWSYAEVTGHVREWGRAIQVRREKEGLGGSDWGTVVYSSKGRIWYWRKPHATDKKPCGLQLGLE